MAVAEHSLATFRGDFTDGAAKALEIWQFGLRFPILEGTPTAESIAALGPVASSLADLWATHLAPHHHPRIRLRTVRISTHSAGGKTKQTADGTYAQNEWNGTKNATGGTAVQYPLQTAAVVSLLTPRAGASGRGRIFLPQLRYPLDAAWGFAEADRDAVAASARALLVAMRPSMGQARVYSTKGFSSPIVGVRVGSVPDTQRSRRGNLDEVYSAVTLPAFP